MVPYWLMFFLAAAGAVGSSERQDWIRRINLSFLAVGILFVLMIGLRFEVGGDWGAYQRTFDQFRYIDFGNSFSVRGSEPAYGFLNWLGQQLGLGVWAVNLVCAAFFVWGLLQLARNQPQPWLALAVAVPFLIIVVGMGYTRQSAALGFFMMALVAMGERRPVKAIMLVLVGATFHTTVVVTLPLLALSYARNRIETLFLVSVAAALGYYFLLAPQLDRYTYGYLEQEYEARGAMVRLIMNLLPAMIFLIFYRRFQVDLTIKTLWRNLAWVGVLSFFVGLVYSQHTVAVDRLALYIIPLQMFVLSRLPGLFARTAASKLMITFLVVLYSGAVQFTWLNFAVHAEFWVPYKTVLTTDEV